MPMATWVVFVLVAEQGYCATFSSLCQLSDRLLLTEHFFVVAERVLLPWDLSLLPIMMQFLAGCQVFQPVGNGQFLFWIRTRPGSTRFLWSLSNLDLRTKRCRDFVEYMSSHFWEFFVYKTLWRFVADFESEGCRFESCRARFCNFFSRNILTVMLKCLSARESPFLGWVGQFWVSQVIFQDFSQ